MLTVNTQVIKGEGSVPKDIGLNSVVELDGSSNTGIMEWEMLSKPKESNAFIYNPIVSKTKIGPLDKQGVYVVRLWSNRNAYNEENKIVSLAVPVTNTGIQAETPTFSTGGGKIRNWSFEIGGPLPGWALFWTTIDDAEILSVHAGITRGRCVPTNFEPVGDYAMALGDDIGLNASFSVGDVFEVYQDVDFTNMNNLKLILKYIKR